jgi:uncharacterized lipoprotein YmbA
MSRFRPIARTLFVLIAAAMITPGCGRSRQARFFVLEPSTPRGEFDLAPTAASEGITVGIAPLKVPAYLDRPQIVTRASDVEVGVAEYYRWAEPLDSSLPRMLARDLEQAPAIRSVVLLPTHTPAKPDRVVLVELFRFDGTPGATVRLSAQYTILDQERNLLTGPIRSEVSASVADASFESLVRAMREAASRFGDELAGAVAAER